MGPGHRLPQPGSPGPGPGRPGPAPPPTHRRPPRRPPPGAAPGRRGRGQDDAAVVAGRPRLGPHPGRRAGPAERPGPLCGAAAHPAGPWDDVPGPGGAVHGGGPADRHGPRGLGGPGPGDRAGALAGGRAGRGAAGGARAGAHLALAAAGPLSGDPVRRHRAAARGRAGLAAVGRLRGVAPAADAERGHPGVRGLVAPGGPTVGEGRRRAARRVGTRPLAPVRPKPYAP